MTFPACRISASDGESFFIVRTAMSMSSNALPEACPLPGSSSSGSSSPYSSSSGDMLVKVSSSLSSGTCVGRDAVSVFPSSKLASSSDSSMPFYEMAASCVDMAAVVRVGAILKRLLPMMSASSSEASLCKVSCFSLFVPNDRHNPAAPLRNRTNFVSVILSDNNMSRNQTLQATDTIKNTFVIISLFWRFQSVPCTSHRIV